VKTRLEGIKTNGEPEKQENEIRINSSKVYQWGILCMLYGLGKCARL